MHPQHHHVSNNKLWQETVTLRPVPSLTLYTGSVWKVISGWIRIESVLQVIFDMQGVAMSNLLLDVVHVELSILGRIS